MESEKFDPAYTIVIKNEIIELCYYFAYFKS